jgi:hypothetical protein
MTTLLTSGPYPANSASHMTDDHRHWVFEEPPLDGKDTNIDVGR